MNHTYFIVYEFLDNGVRGSGNTDVYMALPIKSIKDIREIESKLEQKHGFDRVVITNYIKF